MSVTVPSISGSAAVMSTVTPTVNCGIAAERTSRAASARRWRETGSPVSLSPTEREHVGALDATAGTAPLHLRKVDAVLLREPPHRRRRLNLRGSLVGDLLARLADVRDHRAGLHRLALAVHDA